MKKLMLLMFALVGAALFVSCSSCESDKDVSPVDTAVNFNDALVIVNAEVLTQYPLAQFYEAEGFLIKNAESKVDGTIDALRFVVAYNFLDGGIQKTLLASFNDDLTVNIQMIDDVWNEDFVTTPFVPLDAKDAIDILNAQLEEEIGEGPITLRHQLYPGEPEPRYFIGNLHNLHTINVYTGKIDVPVDADEEFNEDAKQ